MKKKHRFFLNPYSDCAFTKCPKCDMKTKVRKFPLVIHIHPQQLFLLNKQCKYCTNCDLIIAKKKEIEDLMAFRLSQENTEVIGNDYLAIGYGVLAFDVGADGTVLYSNGSAIYGIRPGGVTERLIADRPIEQVVLLGSEDLNLN